MAFELVSYSDLKKVLGLDGAVINEYPKLEVLKPSVEARIESHTGRKFESIERTETIHLGKNPSKMIPLKGLPVTEVASILITDQDGNTASPAATDYAVTDWGLRLDSAYSLVSVAVTYTGGYADDAVPADLNRAALLQTGYEYQGIDNIGASSVSNQGGSIEKPALGLLSEVKSLLEDYMHPLSKAGIY